MTSTKEAKFIARILPCHDQRFQFWLDSTQDNDTVQRRQQAPITEQIEALNEQHSRNTPGCMLQQQELFLSLGQLRHTCRQCLRRALAISPWKKNFIFLDITNRYITFHLPRPNSAKAAMPLHHLLPHSLANRHIFPGPSLAARLHLQKTPHIPPQRQHQIQNPSHERLRPFHATLRATS